MGAFGTGCTIASRRMGRSFEICWREPVERQVFGRLWRTTQGWYLPLCCVSIILMKVRGLHEKLACECTPSWPKVRPEQAAGQQEAFARGSQAIPLLKTPLGDSLGPFQRHPENDAHLCGFAALVPARAKKNAIKIDTQINVFQGLRNAVLLCGFVF